MTPAEVWCAKCDQPSVTTVNGSAYCQKHASIEEWKLNAPAWRRRIKSGLTRPKELTR